MWRGSQCCDDRDATCLLLTNPFGDGLACDEIGPHWQAEWPNPALTGLHCACEHIICIYIFPSYFPIVLSLFLSLYCPTLSFTVIVYLFCLHPPCVGVCSKVSALYKAFFFTPPHGILTKCLFMGKFGVCYDCGSDLLHIKSVIR